MKKGCFRCFQWYQVYLGICYLHDTGEGEYNLPSI